MTIALNILFIIALFLGLFATFFGLPGNFIVLGGVVVYGLVTKFSAFGWGFLVLLAGLAAVGELLEFLFGTFTSVRYGGSKWSALGSFVGGVVGAVLGTGVFPLVGTVIGAFLGALILAFAFEYLHRRHEDVAARAGLGALIGKALGLSTKLGLGLAMVLLVAFRLF